MKKKRAQFVFSEKMAKAIKGLREDYGVASDAQAIRQAVILARYLNEKIKAGYVIQAINSDTSDTKELVIALAG